MKKYLYFYYLKIVKIIKKNSKFKIPPKLKNLR